MTNNLHLLLLHVAPRRLLGCACVQAQARGVRMTNNLRLLHCPLIACQDTLSKLKSEVDSQNKHFKEVNARMERDKGGLFAKVREWEIEGRGRDRTIAQTIRGRGALTTALSTSCSPHTPAI